MALLQKSPILLILLAVSVLALGCGGGKSSGDPAATRLTAELGEVYEIFMMYAKNNSRPPKQLSDLRKLEPVLPMGFQGLQSGKYVAVWGVDVSAKDSGTVLAYEKDAPKKGGAVLMADGSVKTMSAEDVQAAVPKAKK